MPSSFIASPFKGRRKSKQQPLSDDAVQDVETPVAPLTPPSLSHQHAIGTSHKRNVEEYSVRHTQREGEEPPAITKLESIMCFSRLWRVTDGC
jgi:hypothetical protein